MIAATTDFECPDCGTLIDLPASFCSSCGKRITVHLEVEEEGQIAEEVGVPSPWYWLFLVSIPVFLTVNAFSYLAFGFSFTHLIVIYLLIVPMAGLVYLDIKRLEEADAWEGEGPVGYVLLILFIPAAGLLYLYLRNKRVFPREGPSVSRPMQFVLGVFFGSVSFFAIPILFGLITIGLGVSVMRYEHSNGRGIYLVLFGFAGIIMGSIINMLYLFSGI